MINHSINKTAEIVHLWQDIVILLEFCRENEIKPLRSGHLPKKELDRLLVYMNFSLNEEKIYLKRMQLIYAILTELRILVIKNGHLILSSRFRKIMQREEEYIVRQFFSAWVESAYYNELTVLEHLRFEKPSGYSADSDIPGENGIINARKTILKYIIRLHNENPEIPLLHLKNRIQEHERNFLIRESKPVKLEDRFYRGIFSAIAIENKIDGLPRWNNWNKIEGAFIEETVMISMQTLGIIELTDNENNSRVFKLTPVGKVCLELSPALSYKAGSGNPLVIQPNFEIMLFHDSAPLNLYWNIELIGKPLVRDTVSTYRFDFTKIYFLLQLGWTVEDIVKILEDNSGNPLPQNILFTINDLGDRFNRIIIHKHTALVEFTDLEIRDKMLKVLDRESVVWCGKNYLLVREHYLEEAFSLLKKTVKEFSYINYWDRPPRILRFSPDNTFICMSSHPDFGTRWFINEFSRKSNRDKIVIHKIIKNAGEKAKRWFTSAQECLDFLSSRTEGELPESLNLQILAWFDMLGEATAASMPLLILENETTAQHLTTVPELQQHFDKMLSKNIILIRPGRLNEVRKELKKIGINNKVNS